ncbi:MAG: hypothetical protein AAF661_05170 [Pseudomonadota bacterium]
MSTKHTQERLRAQKAKSPRDGAYDYAIVADIDGEPQVIGEAFGRSSEDIWPDAQTNACHFSAAPELLQAAKAFVAHYPHGINPDLDQAWSDTRAAIAKAEGAA